MSRLCATGSRRRALVETEARAEDGHVDELMEEELGPMASGELGARAQRGGEDAHRHHGHA